MNNLLLDWYLGLPWEFQIVLFVALVVGVLVAITEYLVRENCVGTHFNTDYVSLFDIENFDRLQEARLEVVQADIDYWARRHEQINSWRHQLLAPIVAIYTAVLGAVAFVTGTDAQYPTNTEFLLVGLVTIVLVGTCVYARLAITRVHAVDAVSRRKRLNGDLRQVLFEDPNAKRVEAETQPERYFVPGSHFFNDTIIAVLNSGVATTACVWYAMYRGDECGLWPPAIGLLFIAFLALHLLFYRQYLSRCAAENAKEDSQEATDGTDQAV